MPSSLPVSSFLRGALRRLPVETAVVALAAITAIHAVHGDLSLWHARLLLFCALALPLVFAVHERTAPHQRRAIAFGAAVLVPLAIAVLALFPDKAALGTQRAQWATLLLLPAAYLAPFIAAAPRFSLFVRRFFEELTTWSLLGGLSAAALAVTCFAVEELFRLRTERVAADLILLTAAAITLVVLDRLLPDRAAAGKVPELWRKLAVAVGAPFVSAVLLILVVYEATVVVRGELPRNLLSPLLIAAGFVGYLCTLILTSVAAEPAGTAALSPAEPHRFLKNRSVQLARAFPLVLLPLLPMALWAVALRIEQYGLTPFRVVRVAALLCLVVLGLLGTARWLRGRAALGWHVPATVAAFALVIAVGPCSATNLATRSQIARVEHLLLAAGAPQRAISGERAVPSLTLDAASWDELVAAVSDLAELGGAAAMRQLFTGDVSICADRYRSDDCLAGLGLAPPYQRPTRSAVTLATRTLADPVEIPSGSASFLFFSSFAEPPAPGAAPPTATTSPAMTSTAAADPARPTDPSLLSLPCGGGHAFASLAPLLASADAYAPLPAAPLVLAADDPSCTNPGVLLLHHLDTIEDERGRRPLSLEGLWIR